MIKKLVLLFLLLLALGLLSCTQEETTNYGEDQGLQEHSSTKHSEINLENYPYEEISEAEKAALDAALKDEYMARASYGSIIQTHGLIKPFVNIINAEQVHVDELLSIYQKYNLSVPENEFRDNVVLIPTVKDACAAAVIAEQKNVALYDELSVQVDNQDIIAIFTALQSASRDKHLPAFERCGGRT